MIIHTGEITAAEADSYTIRISGTENCPGCAIASLCKSNGSEYMKAPKKGCRESLKKGDMVRIEIAPSLVWKAILFTCVLPLAVLVATAISVKLLPLAASDSAAALAGIAATALYYALVYKFNLLKKYNVKIERLTN